MVRGVRYRVVSAVGTAMAVTAVLLAANTPTVQRLATSLGPVVDRLQPTVLTGANQAIVISVAVVAMLLSLAPLFKPQPRRILDTVFLTQKRVGLAALGLAALGYLDYTFRLPRSTLIVATALLLVVLPPWFVFIRTTSGAGGERAIIIGDDPTEIERVLEAIDIPVLGYVSPPTRYYVEQTDADVSDPAVADGGIEDLELLGGLSRLEDIIVQYDVDTAVFAFGETDREEFFGALAKCHDKGVDVSIHREKADSVLVDSQPGDAIVSIDLEPWDWQDRAVKRLFDLFFAGMGLLICLPFVLLIAVAVKLDSGGSVLYSQLRTTEFGDTFSIYKFRTMDPASEDVEPGHEASHITAVGRILRQTHLDEIPQLWSILVGDMSVVGPRAVWVDEEHLLEQDVTEWRQRWFVKPGLTGLAQINGVTSEEAARKLRYDVEYIRRQSFRFDLAIVIRQLWQVLVDVLELLRGKPDR